MLAGSKLPLVSAALLLPSADAVKPTIARDDTPASERPSQNPYPDFVRVTFGLGEDFDGMLAEIAADESCH